jgi:hypothetical protein
MLRSAYLRLIAAENLSFQLLHCEVLFLSPRGERLISAAGALG